MSRRGDGLKKICQPWMDGSSKNWTFYGTHSLWTFPYDLCNHIFRFINRLVRFQSENRSIRRCPNELFSVILMLTIKQIQTTRLKTKRERRNSRRALSKIVTAKCKWFFFLFSFLFFINFKSNDVYSLSD